MNSNVGPNLLALLKRYNLCRICFERQLPRTIVLPSAYVTRSDKCNVCGGMMNRAGRLAKMVLRQLKQYEFASFLIGARVPAEILEQEDTIRSALKLRGGETLKAQITRTVGEIVADVTGKKVQYHRADVLAILEPKTSTIEVLSRPLFLFGRYLKSRRGILQRNRRCQTCSGQGCPTCLHSGWEKVKSVENILASALTNEFHCMEIRFSWMGSEDDNSLVQGEGRPFYAELLNPQIRSSKAAQRLTEKRLTGVSVNQLEIVDNRPEVLPPFLVKVRINITENGKIESERLRILKATLTNAEVHIDQPRKRKTAIKKVYWLRFRRRAPNRLELYMLCDSGISIRKLVGGDYGSIHPNFATILGTSITLDENRPFDILDVILPDSTMKTQSLYHM